MDICLSKLFKEICDNYCRSLQKCIYCNCILIGGAK